MIEKLKKILEDFNKEYEPIDSMDKLEIVKKKYAGKDSPLNNVLRSMRESTPEIRKEAGGLANSIKEEIFEKLNSKISIFEHQELKNQLKNEKCDVSLPGVSVNQGSIHPLNLVIDEIMDIFSELGYEMIDGTEYEKDEYCFQKLNLPKGHPARDMQDTFYINETNVLRTHSTNMTARLLTEISKKPIIEQNIAAISYGNVYRRDDDDSTHSHQFMQIDGFALGEKINFCNLKWILEYMCKRLFTSETKIRMRPSYFPFTEPSVEVDVTCVNCAGQGCKICKFTGFIEILGSGMINPKVLELNGIDSEKRTGLAFGIGIERIAMLKYGIKNIRDFYENNVVFLKQFKFFGN